MGGGLNKFNYETNTFKKYTNNPNDENSISNNWVKIVLENHYGEIWIATSKGVDLLKKEEEVFYHFSHDSDRPNSISSNDIILLFEDSKNNLWFGTGNGLNIFNRDSNNFSFYTEEDGLPNNVIRGICEDDHGNLWISTNKGISKFINGVNRPESPVFRNYDASDGLPGNEFNSRSCFKGKDGKMYFGGNNGLAVFHPDSVKENPNKPEIIFSDFLIFNKSVEIGEKDSPLSKHISLTKEIVLSYNQSVISIHYAGLNYLAPEKCKFAFMLEGFEKKWNYVGNKREATYTNLDPGKYIFRVKASNNDGVWNEEGTSLKIIITPPFWKTIWFRLFMMSLIILATYTTHLVKVRNIVAYGRELEIKVAERTEELNNVNKELKDFAYIVSHDLKAPLRGINELSNWISEDYSDKLDKEGKENLRLLKERSTKMNSMIQGILEYSRVGRTELETEKVDLNNLVEGVIDLLNPPNNIKITIEDKLPEYTANRTRLSEVFQNLISNAIKYIDKPEGIIKISCTDEGNEWKFGVSDNGPGIEEKNFEKIFKIFQTLGSVPKEGSTGIGLTIVKKIIDLYKGRIWIESEIGKGTTFYFTLPKQ
jgi:signal transduction histidine kinase